MKVSLSILFALATFAYSTGIVLYHEISHSMPPDCLLYPIAPGIWVGVQVEDKFHLDILYCYAAGIGTMTVLGAALGWMSEFLCDVANAGRN